eukprot:489750_1
MGNKNSKKKKPDKLINDALAAASRNSCKTMDGISFNPIGIDSDDPLSDETGNCNSNICKCFERIQTALELHKTCIQKQKPIYSSINTNDYSNGQLLDDYHHVIKCHDFHQMFDHLRIKCDDTTSQCTPLLRNHRKRLSNNDKQIYFVQYSDHKEINCQQILDQIHSYIFHSYDCGYMLNKNDINQMYEIHDTKDDVMLGESARIEKIQSILKTRKVENKCDSFMQPVRYDSNDDSKYDIHDFGIRHYYWGGDSRGEVEGNPKYSNLKEEMLSCNLFEFDSNEWNILYAKATDHSLKKYRLTAKIDFTTECTEIENGSAMRVDHLMGILIYTNYREIKYHFTQTYKRSKAKKVGRFNRDSEGPDLQTRHSIFCNLGKLVWETVNAFCSLFYEPEFIYYGLNQIKLFISTLGRFQTAGPIAAHRNMICGLTSYSGLLLKISHLHGTHFRSEFVSDFTAEQEVLVMGRYENWFDFHTISDVGHGIDYGPYIKAINIIRALMERYCGHQEIGGLNQKILDTVIELLKYAENGMSHNYLQQYPMYIKHLWTLHVTTRSQVDIDVNSVDSFLKPYLCENTGFIKLDVLCDIFRDMKRLNITHSDVNNSLFQYIYQFLLSQHDGKINNKTKRRKKRKAVNGVDNEFNHIISYYCRKYKINLGNDIYDLLYQYFKNAKLQTICLGELSKSGVTKRSILITKWRKQYSDIKWQISTNHEKNRN